MSYLINNIIKNHPAFTFKGAGFWVFDLMEFAKQQLYSLFGAKSYPPINSSAYSVGFNEQQIQIIALIVDIDNRYLT